MARKPRLVIPGLPHHVYDRGNNHRRLFSYESDRLDFLRCLKKGLEVSQCTLQQLTLVGNHFHLVATPPSEAALSLLMKRTKHRYAQLRNNTRDGSGTLFEGRYKSKPIRDDDYLMQVTLYNDANAFMAGMRTSAIDHEWSTGPLHAGRSGSKIPRELWAPSAWYLSLGGNAKERAHVYQELMVAYLASKPECPYDWQLPQSSGRRVERPDRSSAK